MTAAAMPVPVSLPSAGRRDFLMTAYWTHCGTRQEWTLGELEEFALNDGYCAPSYSPACEVCGGQMEWSISPALGPWPKVAKKKTNLLTRDEMRAEADARLETAREAGRQTVRDCAPRPPAQPRKRRRTKAEMIAVRAAAAEREQAAYDAVVPDWLKQADRDADEELERLTS